MILMARTPRHIPAPSRPSDAELVAAALDATRRMGYREAARAIGVGADTISKWRRGQHEYLQGRTRDKLERYLLKHPPPPSPTADTLTGSQRERAMKLLVAMREDFERRYAELARLLREG